MNTHGGFFYTPAADDGASTAASASGFGSSSRPPPTAPRRLTPLQSSRLMAWLDAALLALSRNHRRRHAPDSPLRSLRAYCAAVLPVLAVLASVPPAPPAGSIKVGYLLQLSDVVPEACTGYDAHGGRPTGRAGEDVQQEEHDQEQLQEEELEDVGTTLARALQLMHLIDAQWHALVRGFELDYAAVQAEAAKLFPFIGPPATSAMPPSFDGRHAAAKPREVRQSDGASGRALSQTDRVRLQNIALRARTTLRAWGRAALDVEPLPEEDTFEKEERTRAEGDLEQKPEELDGIVELDDESEQSGDEVVVKQEGEEEEEEMEEVLVPPSTAHSASPPPRPREEQGKDDTEEGRHFANVFSKTFDPDASDEDEEDVKPVISHDYSTPPTRTPLKRQRSRTSSPPARRRAAPADAARHERQSSASPAASPPAQLSEGVLAWDKSFSRIFERTLAALADAQQMRLEREERNAAEGR